MRKAFVGCSGFSYDHWKAVFYPDGLPKRKWLQYYTEKFSTVELNVTFYRLPKQATFEKWRRETPDDFLFAVKGSRYITHLKRLSEPIEPLKKLFDTVSPLAEKLSVVLWQLPPNFKKNTERLKEFLKALRIYEFRHAFEFRNDSWIADEVFDLLKEENCALCMADWPPFVDELPLTADFTYIRRHGHGTYGADYSRQELSHDAQRIRDYMKKGRDVYIYFNNDISGFAPKNALELMDILKTSPRPKRKEPVPA